MSAIAATGVSAPVLGQEQLAEIVVTGSRIKSANLETSTPITQVTADDVVTQGVIRVEDLINQLPQAFAAQNSTVANGADGSATINLRGLGSPRTLVLIDGRRMPYGGVNNSAADVNQIPASLVERVEVMTGGASAVYGSDAVAGVVNFITKKNFEGVEVSAQYGFFQHDNGYGGPGSPKIREVIAARAATNPAQFSLPKSNVTDGYGKEFSVLMGMNTADGRGNMTAYATVIDTEQVLQRDRDFSACSLGNSAADLAALTTQFRCGGSATSAGGLFTDFATYFLTANTAQSFRNYNGSLDAYNFGPLNHFQRPERRYSIGASGFYELNKHAEVYTQLMFTDYRSIAQIAPGGNFFDTSSINCDNPLLPPGSLAAIGCTPQAVADGDSVGMYIGRRNVEGGGRQQGFFKQAFRGVLGVRGEINDAWDYDVTAQFSSTSADEQTRNYFVKDRLVKALDVVSVDGVPTCRSVIDGSDPNCVPYNPFVPNGVTEAQLGYLQATGLQSGLLDQEIYTGVVSGDLGAYGVKLPSAADGLRVVFGTEYRRDSLTNTVDALQEAFQLSGTGGPTIGIDGSVHVKELFFEGSLPIANDVAFAESLTLDAAYRYSDYSTGVETDTYKVGAEWAPVSDVRFRGSYQRAVRAANIVELFTAQGFNLFDIDGDPCGLGDRNPDATAAKCIATGVPAAFVGSGALDSPAGQYNFLQGGNPALLPEESDTLTFGVILRPSFVPGLFVSIDWFNIKIEDTISSFGAENTLNACYSNDDADACSRINRNPNGQLWVGGGFVEDLNINIGSLETTGVDVNISYSGLEIGRFGSLSASLTGTYLDKLVTEPGPGIDPYDCVGFFASVCGTPNPEWRHLARLGWQSPWDVDVTLSWRYYGSVTGYNQNPARIDNEFGSYSYFDLAANWSVTDNARLILGVNNVLDKDPPINASVGTTGNGNTYPQTYDAMGRYVFLRATMSF